MTQNLLNPVPPVASRRYYRSFASYEIPFRPTGPVYFGDTESLKTYYIADHDAAGRITRFEKVGIVRVVKEPHTVMLDNPADPGSRVYFAVSSPTAERASPGKRVNYEETEGAEEYFAGVVGPSGSEATVTHLRRVTAFADEYTYWPNGRLRSRIKRLPGREPTVESFDPDGQRVRTGDAAGELVRGS